MGELFRRSAVVIADGKRFAGAALVSDAGKYLGTEGLRIAFDVTKTIKREPNTAEIKITNLAERTRAQLQGAGVPVTLSAGYASNAAVIFSGDSRTIDHLRDGADWITRIRCGDGERVYQWARVSESFAPGYSISDVIVAVGRKLGINLGNLQQELDKGGFRGNLTQFAHGYVAHGKASLEFDRLLRTVGLSWSIQDGAISVLRGADALSGAAVRLSPDTGLIGSPEHNAPDHKGRPPLLKFRSLLQPQIKVGGAVDLESRSVKGQFRVEALKMTGDTASVEWYSTGEGQPVPT